MRNTSRFTLRKLTVAAAVLAIAGLLLIPARAAALEDPTSPAPSGKDAQATTTDDTPAKKAAEKQKEDEKIRVTEGVTVTAKAPPRKTEISPDVRTLPAAATVLERATIETRPYRETAEILRAAPGMDFVYYGQGGAPSGSAFRGYTDRNFGQDLAGFVDGVPLNVFGAVASHGMMDVTSLLPESIDHIDLIRGPFDIRYGDFHRGGSVCTPRFRWRAAVTASCAAWRVTETTTPTNARSRCMPTSTSRTPTDSPTTRPSITSGPTTRS
jgi:outer membrane cobalamin receptor